MSTKKTPSNLFSYLLVGGLTVSAIVYRKKFKQFAESLKLNLSVLKLEDGKADILIDNLSHEKVLFPIKSVKLINDTDFLAENKDTKTENLIKQNANKTIPFNLMKDTSIQDIEKSNIAVTYNVLGFPVEILYKTGNKFGLDPGYPVKDGKENTDHVCGCEC